MLRIDVTTLISRPVQEVWDFFNDLTNSPRWTRSGSEVRQTSDGPHLALKGKSNPVSVLVLAA
jgi:uncharacterized membrane protein